MAHLLLIRLFFGGETPPTSARHAHNSAPYGHPSPPLSNLRVIRIRSWEQHHRGPNVVAWRRATLRLVFVGVWGLTSRATARDCVVTDGVSNSTVGEENLNFLDWRQLGHSVCGECRKSVGLDYRRRSPRAGPALLCWLGLPLHHGQMT